MHICVYVCGTYGTEQGRQRTCLISWHRRESVRLASRWDSLRIQTQTEKKIVGTCLHRTVNMYTGQN
jgi:hypothetical protein